MLLSDVSWTHWSLTKSWGCGPAQSAWLAWQVVEKMRTDEHGWEMWLPNSGGFWERAKVYNGSHEWAGNGLGMPEAICRAALAALEPAA